MTKEELKQVQEVLLKFYDKSLGILELLELLSSLNSKQLKYLQNSYDIVFKSIELDELKENRKEEEI